IQRLGIPRRVRWVAHSLQRKVMARLIRRRRRTEIPTKRLLARARVMDIMMAHPPPPVFLVIARLSKQPASPAEILAPRSRRAQIRCDAGHGRDCSRIAEYARSVRAVHYASAVPHVSCSYETRGWAF